MSVGFPLAQSGAAYDPSDIFDTPRSSPNQHRSLFEKRDASVGHLSRDHEPEDIEFEDDQPIFSPTDFDDTCDSEEHEIASQQQASGDPAPVNTHKEDTEDIAHDETHSIQAQEHSVKNQGDQPPSLDVFNVILFALYEQWKDVVVVPTAELTKLHQDDYLPDADLLDTVFQRETILLPYLADEGTVLMGRIEHKQRIVVSAQLFGPFPSDAGLENSRNPTSLFISCYLPKTPPLLRMPVLYPGVSPPGPTSQANSAIHLIAAAIYKAARMDTPTSAQLKPPSQHSTSQGPLSEVTVDRPNILFILTDDHAAHAMNCYGSRINETPNLDHIANGGVRLQNCFCTNSICAPSRATILTGTYNHVNGVTTLFTRLNGQQGDYFDPEMIELAERKQYHGYATDLITDVFRMAAQLRL
ncbi:hypothetical protein K4K59_012081 [Colletotrichum sp. SAR11_240]|nr:hypothetical protein K4K59_012081 [Colletotrichum sp. SAR11_240]